MPTYQYQCADCHEALEVHQSFTEDSLTVCPSCQGRLRKIFGAVGVVFKGSGFYATDNRAKPNDATSSGSADSSSTASAKPAESSAKPAEKSAPSPA